MSDLDDVIEDAVSDAQMPEELPVEAPETPAEAAPAGVSPALEVTPEAPTTPTETPVDDFEKKFGITQRTADGTRENRIPYSRVKRITEKAVSDARKEWETGTTPKVTEYETKLKDYEGKLQYYTQFETIMLKEPDKFLQMLSTVPAYSEFFKAVEAALSQTPAPQRQNGAAAPVDDMPAPDQELSDGSMVYSMEGLRQLNAWNRAQARKEVMSEVEKRYAPIEQEWQAQQRVQSVIPQVRKQIEEAKTWPLFNENETEIVKALQDDQRLSLEGAYRKVVFPKIVADRNKIREEVLKEVKAAPRSTSAPTGSTKAEPTPPGPRSLEDIIAEQIKTLK